MMHAAMLPTATTPSTVRTTANRALQDFRTLLAYVRDAALWIQQALAAVLDETKAYVVQLLRVAHAAQAMQPRDAPLSPADARPMQPMAPAMGTEDAPLPLATVAANDLQQATVATNESPLAIADAAPPTPRRCVVVTALVNRTAALTGAESHALGQLGDMYIPTTVLPICPELQAALLESYRRVSGVTAFPQVFVEDVHDSGHRVFVGLDQLNVRLLDCLCCYTVDSTATADG
jgi:hypothetical protein